MNFFRRFSSVTALLSAAAAFAADPGFGDADHPIPLDRIDVTAPRVPSTRDEVTLPSTAAVTAQQTEETINAVDPEDAVKYLPSLFLRKRNYGDTQAVLATRVWGVSSSARSLVFADGLPLSALIANNNNIGAPRWGLVAPAEIDRIDVMYGPFSAAFPGNSMGAVVEITTRLPDKRESSLSQTEAWQHFQQFGTDADFLTHQTAVLVGDHRGKFSFWVSGNYQDSQSQPLSYITSPAFPAGTAGGYAARNKLNGTANILGAGGLQHTRMASGKVKLAYDFSGWLRAAYTLGIWRNAADAKAETYLTNSSGAPTFAGLAGFAAGTSNTFQRHTSHSLSLRTNRNGAWNFEAAVSRYRYDRDEVRSPNSASSLAAPSLSFSDAGRAASLEGTGWSTLDVKGIWRPEEKFAGHTLTFGVHDDRYRLVNPTYNVPDWTTNSMFSTVATEGDGQTRTQAAWLQDAWTPGTKFKMTLGLRAEDWRAYDGYNASGTVAVHQPSRSLSSLSPKARFEWTPSSAWTLTVSAARAFRYATPGELFQLVSTGPTFTAPNPDLKPDRVFATEISLERRLEQGRVRVSLFEDDIHDAIISQFLPLSADPNLLYSYLANVDRVRARGIEVFAERRNFLFRGFEVSGSATYVDARTLALAGAASATTAPGAAAGKRLPNIPDWRASFLVSYRPGERWTFSAGGRYSAMLFTTLDNADVNPNSYQGFGSWFVADLRANYRPADRWALALGVDNVFNREYFLFHPFPQRTLVASVKYLF